MKESYPFCVVKEEGIEFLVMPQRTHNILGKLMYEAYLEFVTTGVENPIYKQFSPKFVEVEFDYDSSPEIIFDHVCYKLDGSTWYKSWTYNSGNLEFDMAGLRLLPNLDLKSMHPESIPEDEKDLLHMISMFEDMAANDSEGKQ